MALTGIVDPAEPETGTVAFDGEVLVDENGDAVRGKGLDDEGAVEGNVVVSEDSVSEGRGQGGEDLGAAADGVVSGKEGERAVSDEIAGEQDEVWGESVGVVNNALEKEGLGVLIEVNVAELNDAIAVEGRGQIWDSDRTGDDVNLVAGDLAGVESQSGGGSTGANEEVAPGEA